MEKIIKAAVDRGASDLHIKAAGRLSYRVVDTAAMLAELGQASVDALVAAGCPVLPRDTAKLTSSTARTAPKLLLSEATTRAVMRNASAQREAQRRRQGPTEKPAPERG